MRHPFVINQRLLFFYGIFWLVFFGGNVFLQTIWYHVPVSVSIVDSAASYLLYPFLGASIWYAIRYNSIDDVPISKMLVFHFIYSTILNIIWIYIGFIIFKAFFPEQIGNHINSLPAKAFGGYLIYVVYLIFFYAVDYYFSFKEKVRKESELKALVKEAELHALKSQINPHFLFNSLNSISSLTMSDPGKAQEMVINLSQLMRYSLRFNQNEKVTFQTELENNKLYLNIEKVRFGNKLNPIFKIDENCLNAQIPNMILQPLYENAIKYGVYETTSPVDVITESKCRHNMLEVKISNTYDPEVIHKKGEGIGLRNIRERLEILYSNPGLIKVEDSKNMFSVTLAIPQN